MYVGVCGRGYNNLYVCSFRSSIRLSDQIDGHTNNPEVVGFAKVLGQLPVPGRPTNLDYIRARAYCACSRCGWGCLHNFSLIYHLSFLSPSFRETARYRLKYCLKGPLSLKQTTNQQTNNLSIRPLPVCLSDHPSISINCLKPLRTFSACPMTLKAVGLRAAGISGC